MSSQCDNQLLARGQNCSVTYCEDCKVYHLHVGPVSMRLEAHMFADMSQTVEQVIPGSVASVH